MTAKKHKKATVQAGPERCSCGKVTCPCGSGRCPGWNPQGWGCFGCGWAYRKPGCTQPEDRR